MVALCIALLTPPSLVDEAPSPLDISVAPVAAVRRGEPLRLEVLLTYRGGRAVSIDRDSLRNPCTWTGHSAWTRLPRKRGPVIQVTSGCPFATLLPGETVRHTVEVGDRYDLNRVPPGRYKIGIQGVLAVVSKPDVVITHLRTRPLQIDVILLEQLDRHTK